MIPIPGMLKVSDSHGNRVDLLLGLKGLDPEGPPLHGWSMSHFKAAL